MTKSIPKPQMQLPTVLSVSSRNRHPRQPVGRRLALWALAFATAFGATGCATLDAVSDVRDSRARAEQRWGHLIAARYQQAWGMHSPGWRELNTFDGWRKEIGSAITWQAAEAVGAECDKSNPKRCIVRIKVTYQLVSDRMVLSPVSREVEELWLDVNGQWWYLPRS